MRIKTGKIVSLLVICTVLLSGGGFFAEEIRAASAPRGEQIPVYVRPDIAVKVEGAEKAFYDARNRRVYPILYNGSTYLPVRACSEIMGEEIGWHGESRTVLIGKTFENPNKIKRGEQKPLLYVKDRNKNERLTAAFLSYGETAPDLRILYDFEPKTFSDEKGRTIEPFLYNGSVYLPVRAVTGLINAPIHWDGVNLVISIGTPPVSDKSNSSAARALREQFEKQLLLYDTATTKILNLRKTTDPAILKELSASVSRDSVEAERQKQELLHFQTSDYTEAEKQAYESLVSFSEVSSRYILVLENITYMAAQGQDYSVLAETFLNFALASQQEISRARERLNAL